MLEIIAGVIGLMWAVCLMEAIIHMTDLDPLPTLVTHDEWLEEHLRIERERTLSFRVTDKSGITYILQC